MELLLEALSKWPDRFSRKLACIANPESLREMGVRGKGGKEPDIGDILGEGGELPLDVELVDGRSGFDCKNALNNGGLGAKWDTLSPKEAEFRPANLARDVGGALTLKIEGFSEAKASNGKASIAYAGGPTGIPYRLWCGADNCNKDVNLRRCCLGRGVGRVVDSISSWSKSTSTKSSSGSSIVSYRRSIPTIYGHGASRACISLAGRTGINTPAQVMGYKSSTKALLARWSIDV